jgi:Icc-related predicted phosphoesterase
MSNLINDMEQIDQAYRIMMYVNSGLLVIVGALFGAVAWYFKQDYQSHRERIDKVETHVEKILMEIQSDREREKNQYIMLERMVKILAKKTNTDIGL